MKTFITACVLALLFPLLAQAQSGTRDDPTPLEEIVSHGYLPRPIGNRGYQFGRVLWMMEGGRGFGAGGFSPNRGNRDEVRDAAEKDCDEQAGNPVVLSTGNKVESVLDFSSEGEMGLYLRRSYNHYWAYSGLFGRHWVSNFDYSLVPPLGGNGTIWAQRPDGRRIKFLWKPSLQRYEEDKAAPVAYIVYGTGGSFIHRTEDHTIETYDPHGYVQTVQNRQGVGWSFSYTGNYLQTVTHTSGRSVDFTWSSGRLTRITDPDGVHYDYAYDANAFGSGRHRLASVTLPGTSGQPAAPATLVEYHYEDSAFPGALTGISWAGQRYSKFEYDSQGRVTSSKHAHPSGSGWIEEDTFQYSGSTVPPSNPPPIPPPPGGVCPPSQWCDEPRPAPGPDFAELIEREQRADAALAILSQPLALTQVTHINRLGKETLHTLVDGRITDTEGLPSTHCAASLVEQRYDGRDYPTTVTDANGNITRYTWNDHGQPESITEADGSADARTTSWNWDVANNRPNWIEVQGDHRQSFEYGSDHRLKKHTVKNLSAYGTANQTRSTDYTYTSHSNGLLKTAVADGPLPGTGDAITRTYSAQGDLIEVKNSLGHAVTYSLHNDRGQPGRIVGVNGEKIEYDYDARGRVRRMRTFHNNVQKETTWSYAASGLLESITTPDGVTESYTYDRARRLATLTRNTPDGTLVQTLTYDQAGNLTQEETTLAGTLIARSYTDYDELNRVRARRGNDGQEASFHP